jgi:hypothetical protein
MQEKKKKKKTMNEKIKKLVPLLVLILISIVGLADGWSIQANQYLARSVSWSEMPVKFLCCFLLLFYCSCCRFAVNYIVLVVIPVTANTGRFGYFSSGIEKKIPLTGDLTM